MHVQDANHANPEHTEVPSLIIVHLIGTRHFRCHRVFLYEQWIVSPQASSHAARTEIVQTLATLIWTHTHYPSPDQYNVVCTKLVEVYPTLADDQEPGWVSRIT